MRGRTGTKYTQTQLYIPLSEKRRGQFRQKERHEQDTRSSADEDGEDENGEVIEEHEEHEETHASEVSETEAQTETQGPRRSQRTNKGIPPKRFGMGGVRVCHIYIETKNYKVVLELPAFEKENG